ncbi:hypothetical protein C8R47DRAFT_1079918 [Mycena vitilis]|nr:hypothetical protein C8R47DRAFT_1079918 [Mycena vitilis]
MSVSLVESDVEAATNVAWSRSTKYTAVVRDAREHWERMTTSKERARFKKSIARLLDRGGVSFSAGDDCANHVQMCADDNRSLYSRARRGDNALQLLKTELRAVKGHGPKKTCPKRRESPSGRNGLEPALVVPHDVVGLKESRKKEMRDNFRVTEPVPQELVNRANDVVLAIRRGNGSRLVEKRLVQIPSSSAKKLIQLTFSVAVDGHWDVRDVGNGPGAVHKSRRIGVNRVAGLLKATGKLGTRFRSDVGVLQNIDQIGVDELVGSHALYVEEVGVLPDECIGFA